MIHAHFAQFGDRLPEELHAQLEELEKRLERLEELVAALQDEDFSVRTEAARALGDRGDSRGILPMYEVVQDERVDPPTRYAVAEALVRLGLLRRQRVGPTRMFLWLLGATLAIVSAAAASTIGVVGAIALFAAGAATLVGYYRRVSRQERDSRTYIGPDGATIRVRPALTR